MARTFIEDIVRSLINERQLFGNHKQQPLFLTSDPASNGDINYLSKKTNLEYEELTINETGLYPSYIVSDVPAPVLREP